MASDRDTLVPVDLAPTSARHAHAHGGLPHSHGGHAGAPTADKPANPPAVSLLRLSIRLRLTGAIACAALIWAATHWATT
jgi:hypothetical protein